MRLLTNVLPSVLLVLLVVSSARSATIQYWTPTDDFRTSPNQQNPSADRYGNSGVWSYMDKQSDRTRDGNYALLPNFEIIGPSIVQRWIRSGTDAWAAKNVTAFTWNDPPSHVFPAGEFQVHPPANGLAVVAWQSPISGYVAVDGLIADRDPGGGDGVNWFIDYKPAAGAYTSLAGGGFGNGGSQQLYQGTVNAGVNLNAFQVNPGDTLYFVIDRSAVNHWFDATAINVRVRALTPDVWNLHDDFGYMQRPSGGVQSGDGYSHTWFYDYAPVGTLATSYTRMDTWNAAARAWNASASGAGEPTVGPRSEDSIYPADFEGVHVHTGSGDLIGDTIVTWKAPAAGTYRFDFAAQHLNHGGGDGVRFSVRTGPGDATVVMPSAYLGNTNDTDHVSWAASLPLAAGQEVHFRVGRNANHGWDSTNVQVTAQPTVNRSWSPATDFGIGVAQQQSTHADIWGNAGVWRYMYKNDLDHNGGYVPLEILDTSDPLRPTWIKQGADSPMIAQNVAGSAFMPSPGIPGWVWESGDVVLHPGPTNLAVLAWQSPTTAYVSIAGGFKDQNPGGGDGVDWYIDMQSGGNYTTLAQGTLANGGAQLFENGTVSPGVNLSQIRVGQGDYLYFIVNPRGSYGWDSTVLSLRIDEMVPEPGTWVLLALGGLGLALAGRRPRRR